MFPIIDFRNGRYQGQTKNHLPDGIGILIDKNQLFCLAEWTAGEIRGPAAIIYPSGQTFCGHIAYRKPQQLHLHELHLDHVQLITFSQPRAEKDPKKIAAVLPLLGVILQIDNTDPREALVANQYTYSTVNEDQNVRCISNILNLDSKGPEALKRHTNCIKFMQEYFAFKYEDIIEFLVHEKNGKKQYFFGLRGEGLGIKIEPLEELTLSRKKTGRVYIVRALGVFTRQNQMKDLGYKTLDNAMKGYIYQQGIYSQPNTLIKYQITQEKPRPVNCLVTFYNYLKRSLHYRDKVLLTAYMYSLQNFVALFNEKLRKIETERLAQMTIAKPNNSGANLQAIEQIRSQKQRQKQQYLRRRQDSSLAPNPYNPSPQKFTNPEYNLQRARDQIYRSASKRQKAQDQLDRVDYNKVEYIDPNYRKVSTIDKQPRNYQAFLEKDKNNQKKYQYESGKDYVKDLNQYYQKKFTPKKYDTMDTSYRKDRGDSRSPIARDYPQRSYQKRSPPRVTPERNYRDRSPKYTPERSYQYVTDANDPDRYNEDSLEYRPYQRQQRYRSRPYNDPRQEISYEKSRPRDNYDYYDSRPYEKSPYRDGQARLPGRPANQYSRSPSKGNLRKKVVEQNRYDYN